MVKIYVDAWGYMRRFWWGLLAVALILEVLPLFLKGSHIGGELAAGCLVAYGMHRFFLFGEGTAYWKKDPSARKPTIGRFMGASLLIAGLVLVAIGILAVRLVGEGTSEGAMFLVFLTTYAILPYVTLILFGTALPASAAGDRFGPGPSLRRAGKTAGPIAGGLLVGPGLFGLMIFFGYLLPIARLDIPESRTGTIFAISVGSRMIGFFLTALTVAVLCRAYRKVAPAEIGLQPVPQA